MRSFLFAAATPTPRIDGLAVAAIIALVGCNDLLSPHDRPPSNVTMQPACTAARGTIHSELRPGSQRLRRATSPHWVMQTITVSDGTLTIEAGTTVCFAAGAVLQLDSARVEGHGSRTAPVVLTAMDPAQPWGGIGDLDNHATGDVSLRNARLEHAAIGVSVNSFVLDSTVIRQIRGPAIRRWIRPVAAGGVYANGKGRISRSVVDSACFDCRDVAAVEVYVDTLIVEETVIRGSGGHGILARGGGLLLRDVRIEGSAQTGLVIIVQVDDRGRLFEPRFVAPVSVRITEGQSYPAEVPASLVNDLIPDAAVLGRLMGNAKDALLLSGGIDRETVVHAGLPWMLTSRPTHPFFHNLLTSHTLTAHLRMEPGAALHGDSSSHSLIISAGGRITAEGTPDRPVILSDIDIQLRGQPSAASRIAHARLDSVRVQAGASHPVEIDHVVGNASALVIDAAGSHVSHARFDGTRRSHINSPSGPLLDTATVIVRAPGTILTDVAVRRSERHGFLLHGSNIRLSRCEASANGADGVHVTEATSVQITACNLFANAGLGVNNIASVAVDARGNWWGSPDGPTAPTGDGVSARVDYVPYLPSPVTLTGTTAPMNTPASAPVIRPAWVSPMEPPRVRQ